MSTHSLLASDFGVVADGTTDDTAALRTAIATAVAEKKILKLPAGEILVTDELFDGAYHENVTIRGAGMNATTIVNGCIGVSPFNIGNTYWTELADFHIEGNGLTGGSGNGHAISMIDPVHASGTYLPGEAKIERIRITGHRGEDVRFDGASHDACGIYASNALQCSFEDLFISECSFGAYFYQCQQPKLYRIVFVYNHLSGIVDDQCEKFDMRDSDLLPNDADAPSGLVTLHGGYTQKAGSYVCFASWGSSVTGCKFKNQLYAACSLRSSRKPLIANNWIVVDQNGAAGVYSEWGARIRENVFARYGPFTGSRTDVLLKPYSGVNDIGDVSGNYFRWSGGGNTTALINVDGSAAGVLRGTIRDNVMGDEIALTNSGTLTDAIRISGNAGSIEVTGNRLMVPSLQTVTNAWNIPATVGPAFRFTDNAIKVEGTGAVTNQIVGLPAPYNTTGYSVDSAAFRYRLPSLASTATYDPPSLTANGTAGCVATTNVTVTGAALGDAALVSFSLSTSGLMLAAAVTAANTVTVTFFNPTNAAINLASGTLSARVFKTPF